jgi:hypothetical protein
MEGAAADFDDEEHLEAIKTCLFERIYPLPADDPMRATYAAVAQAAHSFNRGVLSSDSDGRRGKETGPE